MIELQLAYEDGSNPIDLLAAEAPSPRPVMGRNRKVSTHTMLPGQSGPGKRVVQDFGTALSWRDVEITCPGIGPETMAALEALHDVYPVQQVRLSFDGGDTQYLCSWQANGLQHARRTYNEERFQVTIRLHVNTLIA